ncbi:lipopolysaccharide biosynthesis protein [Qipengyuania pelagi]|jgi:PST family polysaccharide transporter|uniref:Oligosaccharide flippase family protein n=1 Tax=Qipengyuania pelagi TaxID=994320 RepID=A0A844YAN5_9SPHN|nr:lipopolysaccharide biosynthesis protein [Qipengyuania pelagi]MXO54303.1 oligosaccharide flippase family protein [Qipengyuania pelagi]
MNNQSGRKVLKGAAWMGAGRIVVNLSGFISTIVLARLLSPDDFGLVAIAMAAAAVVGSVSELSLTQALVQFDDPEDDDYHSAWTLNLLRACAISAILMAIAWPMAAAYSEPRLIPIFAVVAFTAAARALENPRIVVFRRALDFRPDFEFDVVEKIVSLVVAVAIAFVLRSYWALIFGAAAATLARVALTYIKMPYRPRFHLSRWRALMSFSIWLTFSEIVKTISLRAVPLVVGAFLPTVAVGQFSVGERVASMPVRESIGALQATLFPAFSRMADDLGRMRAAYVRAQAMTSLAALPFGFGLAAVAQPVVLIVLGAKWLPAVPVLQAVAIASSVQAIQNALPLAMATGRTNEILWRNVRSFLIQMPLLVLGLAVGRGSALGGLEGLSIALVASAIANSAINMAMVRKLVASPFSEQISLAARPFLASVVMAALVLLLVGMFPAAGTDLPSILTLAAIIAAGIAAYAASLFALHAMFGGPASSERELAGLALAGLARVKPRARTGTNPTRRIR